MAYIRVFVITTLDQAIRNLRLSLGRGSCPFAKHFGFDHAEGRIYV
jgi:hypothetical protein